MKQSSLSFKDNKPTKISTSALKLVLAVSSFIALVFAFFPGTGLMAQLFQGGLVLTFPLFLMAMWCILSFITAFGVAVQLATAKYFSKQSVAL